MRILLWDHYDAGMGGIEKLIITLAIELAKAHEIVVIARKHGTICEALAGLKAEYIHVDPAAVRSSQDISPDDLLIDFGAFRDMQALSKVNPRLLLWRVYPNMGCKGRFSSLCCRCTLTRLDKRSSLVFMDTTCYETACRELRRRFRKCILPLPIIPRDKKYVVGKPKGTINITYIGRGSQLWKVKPVKKLVTDLRAIADRRFHVHVFTDTDELFEAELAGVKGGNVAVDYQFGYTMERLSQKLLELSDLHYSMGTACLEGAVLGIPTIIADGCHADFPADYRYRWLIEDMENYAGVFLEDASPGGHSLREIMDTLRDPQELQRVSDATYAETTARFSSRRVVQVIESLRPRARVRDVLRFMPSYWLSGGSFFRMPVRSSSVHVE